MAFESVTNLAQRQAAEDERRRREEQQRLERDLADQQASEKSGPAGLLDELTGGKRVGVDPRTMREAEEDRFLNEQARDRLRRRAEPLAIPGKTAAERVSDFLGPLTPFALEDSYAAREELRTDPRGRLARLQAAKSEIDPAPSVSRETPPIYYSGNRNPTRGPAPDSGVTPAGAGPETMPYTGALEGLQGAEVPRAGIRREFGGTAPDEVLRFSDRPEPGMRRYNAASGATKDVGAPGGGLTVVGDGGRHGKANELIRGELDTLIEQAQRAPLTPVERAQDRVKEEPLWDVKAAGLQDPGKIGAAINQAIAARELDPATGNYLLRKYDAMAKASTDEDGFNPEEFADRLAGNRAPAPGEAEARAREGGTIAPAVQAAKTEAVQNATTPVPGTPGTTPRPDPERTASNPGEALLGQILRPQRQAQTVGGAELGYEIGGDFIPPNMRQIPAQLAELGNAAQQAAPAPGGEAGADLSRFADLPENIRLMLEGATFAAGGREAPAERRRRLAREAARR